MSTHGSKHQTTDNCFGCSVDVGGGPTSLRRNDNAVLRISDINDRMKAVQERKEDDDDDDDEVVHIIIFGDSAYRRRSHITSYLKKNDDVIDDYRIWNGAMKRRFSIDKKKTVEQNRVSNNAQF